MNQSFGGILLPESVLSSPWFGLLATVVAFNTIVYVGLTLSKLMPLPEQIHPSQVRRWLAIVGMEIDKDSAMNSIQPHQKLDPNNPYEGTRGNIAARSIPQAFALAGLLGAIIAIGGFVLMPSSLGLTTLIELVGAMAFLVAGQILGRIPKNPWVAMWAWTIACLAVVAVQLAEALILESTFPIVYALMIMTSFPAIALAWRPSIIGSVLMFASVTVVSLKLSGEDNFKYIIAALATALIGLALLKIRLVAIDSIADEQARAASMASTDPLTQTLTRTGLRSLMPSLGGIAQREGQEICVMYFDIDQFAKTNASYGATYGDEVLRIVAQAIREKVRVGDLVARWDGDEFLVAGIGQRVDAQVVANRVTNAVRDSGINLGRWATTVSVGTSAGDPANTTFDSLLAEAKADLHGEGADSRSLGKKPPA